MGQISVKIIALPGSVLSGNQHHTPRICAAICAYNAGRTIARAIESAASQTFHDIEILVIDDGSTDDTNETVAKLAEMDPRIRLVHQSNRGISASRNRAFELATADIVAFLDADDQWLPMHLEALADQLDNTNVSVAFSNALLADHSGRLTGERSRTVTGELHARDVLFGNPCTTCSTMAIRTEAFAQTGPFREGLDHAEDQEWILRCLLKGNSAVCTGDATVVYRTSSGGQSADLTRMHDGFRIVLSTAEEMAPELVAEYRREAKGRMMLYFARRAIRVGHGRLIAARYLCAAIPALPRLIHRGPELLVATIVTIFWPTSARRLAGLRNALSLNWRI